MQITESEDILVWKALADPTRRALLDSLREAPQTTGALSAIFNHVGRCAIMKHLGILQQANLISVQRQGKYRWNYLNAIPIQNIYERWVKQYQIMWTAGLSQLKKYTEHSLNSRTMDTTISTATIKLSVPIKAPQDHVWKCLLHEVNAWWPHDFYTSSKTQKFTIEPQVGGRMYEDYGNNEGLLWAQVIVLESPKNLELKGHLTPQFGGPALNFLKLTLTHQDGITSLELTDTVMGEVDQGNVSSLESGWKMLFAEAFKAYTEKTA